MDVLRMLEAKKRGKELSEHELQSLMQGISDGAVPDYQTAAWLMASFINGLSANEVAALTRAMIASGTSYRWRALEPSFEHEHFVDKHSTGGVGDKVSFLFAPLAASLGFKVPMIAGRTLGHTGGTIDKLEGIPGFRTDRNDQELLAALRSPGFFIVGQSEKLCPADRRLYALRDVTATVDHIGLITASIVSKKSAEGCDAVVFDVKTGAAAFMSDPSEARRLARSLVDASKACGMSARAVVSRMDQPLGRLVGNTAEVIECLEILRGDHASTRNSEAAKLQAPLIELSVELTCQAAMASRGGNHAEWRELCFANLSNGKALASFHALCESQGASLRALESLRLSTITIDIEAQHSGILSAVHARPIGEAGLSLAMGRRRQDDRIIHGNTIEILKAPGSSVLKGEALLRLYLQEPMLDADLQASLEAACEIRDQAPDEDLWPRDWIVDRIE